MKQCVYFAFDEISGHIKVGYSKIVGVRLSALNRDNGKMRLIGAVKGGRLSEMILHEVLAPLRVKHGTSREWYLYSPLLETWLRSVSLPFSAIPGICGHGINTCKECCIRRGKWVTGAPVVGNGVPEPMYKVSGGSPIHSNP